MNIKIKKILVPFDFSEESINAYKAAEKLALQLGAKISLVYAITPLLVTSRDYVMECALPFGHYEQYNIDLKKGIHEFIEEDINRIELISNYKVELGYWNKVITEYAERENSDIIIVGNTRYNNFDNLGNKISPIELIKETKIPVITITKHFSNLNYQSLVLPIRNVVNWYDKVPFIVSIAKQTGALVHLIGMTENAGIEAKLEIRNNLDYIIALFVKNNIRFTYNTFYDKPIIETLKNYSFKKNADIIALTPDNSFNLINFFRPGFFNKFLAITPSPVMGVRLN